MFLQNIFLPLLRKLRITRYLNLTLKKKQKGSVIRVPLLGDMGLSLWLDEEPWMQKLLSRYVQDQGAFLDVGANVGQTLAKVKATLPHWNYVGLEPNPTCVSYLNLLVQLNQWEQIRIIPAALMDLPGPKVLYSYLDSQADTTASLIPEYRGLASVKKQQTVMAVSWDQIQEQFVDLPAAIQLIKVDVEGAELEVLRTLKPHLASMGLPDIICEVLPIYTADNQVRMQRQQAIQEILHLLGYAIYRIGPGQALQKMDQFPIPGDVNYSNYLFSIHQLL